MILKRANRARHNAIYPRQRDYAMSIFNKTSNGWQPQQLTIKDVKFATGLPFCPRVFAVYDFILLARCCRKLVSILAGNRG